MALILNIETATTNCSVSLAKNGDLLYLKEDKSPGFSHAELLHVYIKELFQEAELSQNDLDAVAVSKGPGSYTGLRIGVSAAKGLCFALDKPLLSINTLESLAHSISVDSGFIVPMLDARRMEVYSVIFDNRNQQLRNTQAEIIDDNSFEAFLKKGKVHFIGSGSEKTKTVLSHKNARFIDGKLPSAKEMCKLSYDKYSQNDFEDVAYFEPFYLKEFISLKT